MSRSIHAPQRGVALLIVVTILVTMVIVAVPFALSMRQGQQRTEAARARGRAVFEADILCEMTKLFLVRTTPSQEDERYTRGDRSIDALSAVDSLDEITPTVCPGKNLQPRIDAARRSGGAIRKA